jgi:hypothetical protein
MDHSQHYTLDVTKGMPEGHEVVYEGEGDENPDWDAGDVVLRVRSRKERGGWRRKESTLYWTETIGVAEVGICALTLFCIADNSSPRPSSALTATSPISGVIHCG